MISKTALTSVKTSHEKKIKSQVLEKHGSYVSAHSKNPSINSRFFNPRPKNNLAQNKILKQRPNFLEGSSYDAVSTGSLGNGGMPIDSPEKTLKK